ncbi:hypothetical protein LRD18_03525 [Halorhodospira halochloris]|uniref:3-hydroxyacyl-ACP dehydratase FabZ family protein n=1 Tax=Halorhodospira halochloris TaxID=1052 RepID=UPI001EE82A66|nr:MaoC/PaaZ C-terminal domain-containing protein [Halorhodospira halochloris]MCG5529942.1 hypothetical protein [Halorhodospira halochloris]
MEICDYFSFDSDHPSLSGHFPGDPVVPGSLLLEKVLHALESLTADRQAHFVVVSRVKFIGFVRPEQEVEVRFVWTEMSGRWRFECSCDGEKKVEGELELSTERHSELTL